MKLLDALPACEADELDVLILATRFRWGSTKELSFRIPSRFCDTRFRHFFLDPSERSFLRLFV